MVPECTQVAQAGKLYIVGTPIGNLGDLSLRAAAILKSADIIACEDTRVTAKLMHYLGLSKDLVSYRDANEEAQANHLLESLQNGKSIALVSDAGTPTISDPGFRLVRLCRKAAVDVIPVPGPAAFVAALSASGLPSDRFQFIGFLPPKSAARKRFFEEILNAEQTTIFYESSHRIEKFMNELVEILGDNRVICVAREITKLHETFLVGKSAEVLLEFRNRSQKGEFVVLIAPQTFTL